MWSISSNIDLKYVKGGLRAPNHLGDLRHSPSLCILRVNRHRSLTSVFGLYKTKDGSTHLRRAKSRRLPALSYTA